MKWKKTAAVVLCSAITACSGADGVQDGRQLALTTDSMFGAASRSFTAELNPDTPRRAVISAEGIGIVHRGMTLGDVRSAAKDTLTVGTLYNQFLVDTPAVPVIAGGDTLYHLLFPPGVTVTDKTPVESVATMDEAVRTDEGVGPGMLLSDAAGKYGLAVLQYNTNDEMREYASFATNPIESMTFRVDAGPGKDGLAGIYETHNEYNRTLKYRRDARIMMIIVKL
jgi:hypothetical protein